MNDEKSGAAVRSIADSAEHVFGVGPGARIGAKRSWMYVNGYVELCARNRHPGWKLSIRLSKAP